MINLYEMTLSELEVFLISKGFKKFNARQIFEWIYKKKVINFDEMLNLSKILREFLVDSCILSNIEVSTRMISSDGTEKFLLKLEDGNIIESVLF